MTPLDELEDELEAMELRLLTEIWHLESLLLEIYKRIDARHQNFDRNFSHKINPMIFPKK